MEIETERRESVYAELWLEKMQLLKLNGDDGKKSSVDVLNLPEL